MKRLSKSGIEYLDYMWGVWSGCRNLQNGLCLVQNCWAKGIAIRFKPLYPNGFEPTFYPEAIDSPKHLRKPSIIGVGWVGDIIGYCYKASERLVIFDTIRECPQHTFLFLTKNPDRLLAWGQFPDNCRVGVTATDNDMAYNATASLALVKASIKYISFEPLFSRISPAILNLITDKLGMQWVIIGAQTKPYKPPKLQWVEEIIFACVKADIPYFLKDNLGFIIPGYKRGDKLHQEMPKIPN